MEQQHGSLGAERALEAPRTYADCRLDVKTARWDGSATGLAQHPLATISPAPTGNARDELKRSIERSGEAKSILMYKGMVIDGWPEYVLCGELQIVPDLRVLDVDEEGAMHFVFARCLESRAPPPAVRSMMLAVLCDSDVAARHGGSRALSTRPLSTRMQRASEAGVSVNTQRKNEHVSRCCPRLIMDVISGKLTPDAAYKSCTVAEKKPKAMADCKCKTCSNPNCWPHKRISRLEDVLRAAGMALPP